MTQNNKKLDWDTCRCANEDCPLKDNCLRNLALHNGDDTIVSITIFTPYEEDGEIICDNQIKI